MNDETSSTGAKLQEFYSSLGIDTRDANGQLRNFYDVLDEMGGKWDTLTSDQKKYYALIQAGANQSQNLLAVLGNWKDAKEATGTALDSQNSAMEENEKVLNSVQGKLNKLQSALQKLSHDFMSSDLLKSGIDVVTKLVEGLDLVISKGGAIGKLGVTFGTLFAGARAFGLALTSTGKKASGLYDILSKILTFGMGADAFKIFSEGSEVFRELKDDAEDVGKTVKGTAKTGEALKNTTEGVANAMDGVADATKIAEKGTEEAVETTNIWSKALGGLKANIGMITGALAVMAVIIGAIKIDEHFNVENSLKRMHEYEGQLGDVKKEIDELEKKRENGTITRAEQSQLRHLKLEERTLLMCNRFP